MKLENKQIGIFAALIAGVMMLVVSGTGSPRYNFKPEELAKAIAGNEDHISSDKLSRWIIEGKSDYRLIDIRSAEDFKKGSIKTAKNITLTDLLTVKTLDREFSDDKTIVLYSNGDSHANQAWLVLKSAGKDVVVLTGGFNGWVESILNPKMSLRVSDDEVLKYRAASSMASFFGGSAETSSLDNDKKVSGAGSEESKKTPPKGKKGKVGGC